MEQSDSAHCAAHLGNEGRYQVVFGSSGGGAAGSTQTSRAETLGAWPKCASARGLSAAFVGRHCPLPEAGRASPGLPQYPHKARARVIGARSAPTDATGRVTPDRFARSPFLYRFTPWDGPDHALYGT